MRNAAFLTSDQLAALGFAHIGEGALIHETCVLVGCEHMSVDAHARIDPFCILSAREPMHIGRYVHIAGHCLLAGAEGITVGDFANISHGVRILSASDDFVASALIGAQVPGDLRAVQSGRVYIGKHACIGANSVVLPKTNVHEGSTVGALSLVRGELTPWGVYAGIPARRMRERDSEGVRRAEAELIRRGG
ncbi:MAG: acyltransferase [Vitreimonas sp.]